jgi:hypothetical protein
MTLARQCVAVRASRGGPEHNNPVIRKMLRFMFRRRWVKGPDNCAGSGEGGGPAMFRPGARYRFKRETAQRPEKFQEQPRLLLFVSINRSTRNRVAL